MDTNHVTVKTLAKRERHFEMQLGFTVSSTDKVNTHSEPFARGAYVGGPTVYVLPAPYITTRNWYDHAL